MKHLKIFDNSNSSLEDKEERNRIKRGDNFAHAAFHGDVNKVRSSLKNSDVDPAYKGNLAFVLAAMSGHMEVIKLLLADSRTDPNDMTNDYKNSAINYARIAGHKNIEKILIDYTDAIKDLDDNLSSKERLVIINMMLE